MSKQALVQLKQVRGQTMTDCITCSTPLPGKRSGSQCDACYREEWPDRRGCAVCDGTGEVLDETTRKPEPCLACRHNANNCHYGRHHFIGDINPHCIHCKAEE